MGARLRLLFKLAVAAALGFGGWLAWHLHAPRPLPATPLEFAISEGSSLRATAVQLQDAGLIANPWAFVLLGRILGRAGEIKAGHYQVSDPMSPRALLDLVTRGMVTQSAIKFIEGWNLKQVRGALAEHPDLRHDTPVLSDAQLAQAVGATEPSLEGLIFPDTYYFPKGATDLSVLKRAYRGMQQELTAAWSARAPDLPLGNPYEGLILASIVEKETGSAAERPMIAGVFVNRLKRGMRLETDPAVIYGLGESFDGNLRKRDLLADTPYNTYTRAGLPPTPIAMPGQASLQAALNPTRTNALYFVARGDGTSQFSATLAEHERAVTKYQRKR
ncbi:MAG TPA: endolytic transglycosylase MltG [Burkholderiales bacterium]|nr:endolytic transglycosylase MltG [Burkholderiales bacterium]